MPEPIQCRPQPPVIEATYTLSATAAELQRERDEARRQMTTAQAEKERLQSALFQAHEQAALWFACTVALLIVAVLLCAALAVGMG